MRIKLDTAIRISLLLVLAVMTTIFCFSAENGDQSSRTSGEITEAVIVAIYPDYSTYSRTEQISIYRTISHTVRKTAHFVEFSALGFSLMLFFAFFARKKTLCRPEWYAWIIGALYAGSDELHQHFVGGRGSSIKDVALDSLGVLFGLIIVRVFFLIHDKKKEQG